MSFAEFLTKFDEVFWGLPLIALLLGAGIVLTIRTRFIQFRRFPYIIKHTLGKIFEKGEIEEGAISPFQALSTALAATVGTGNIVGVSVAILGGGPGAVFWMWVAAFFGMCTKFSEVNLAIAYRVKTAQGGYAGGPMYYIERGLKKPWLGKAFALFAAIATLGIGNSVQSNAIANTLNGSFNVPKFVTAVIITALAAVVVIGGIQSIAKVTEKLVPFMATFYIIGGLIIIFSNIDTLGSAIASIFIGAFNPQAAGGGALGYTIMMAMRNGISRGVFTNEAGLGSSPIAHATASTDHPTRQGIWGVTEVFLDTFIVCTITALVILTSGVLDDGITDPSVLVSHAFATKFVLGKYIVSIGLLLFAFSTILSWEYYGETSIRYLLGDKVSIPYKVVYLILTFIGCTMNLGLAWTVANILNGFMAIPNLIALIGLSGVVYALAKDFFADDRVRKSPDEYKHLLR
ncbi:AGCS family alanine or glycine:cation symporter [Peptoniphilus ivorii]|uniref:alanine/glycine:cation symporter family protein n=1 Tax=Aedoeadaptatus ivorii TaxID=54006 RepID=UPI0027805ECB|nr:sodium:alanine symporter family protein [Peptoniphilus ivorii]MDQ0508721.1 AGCS family alanine or glycine:cation symporter [Peptoniphilus ivorii]